MTAPAKKARMVARIPPALRRTIQAAADIQGSSLNQFVVQAALREANVVLERETSVRLTREQGLWLSELLDQPPRPNNALVGAKSEHRKLLRVRG